MENQKDGNLEDSARGQADLGSAAVYTMDRPSHVICMYECVGTVSRPHGPKDPLVVLISSRTRTPQRSQRRSRESAESRTAARWGLLW